MTRSVYKNLAKMIGIALVVVGALAIYGGTWAHGFVSDQLKSQQITMPAAGALTTQDMVDHLGQYSGQTMASGPQAKAYSEYFIHEHMMAASQGKTYSQVAGEVSAMTAANPQIQAGTASAADMAAYNKLNGLKTTLFMGDSLRGMLLTAYAWWTVGSIAIVAGVALVVVGAVALLYGFLGKRATAPQQA